MAWHFDEFLSFCHDFNTAISLYYSLAKRFSGDDNHRFKWILIGLVLVGFILSFAGFKKNWSQSCSPSLATLVASCRVVVGMDKKTIKKLKPERINRRHIFYAFDAKKLDDSQSFNKTDEKQLNKLIENSVIMTKKIEQDMTQLVKDNLDKS